VVAATVVVVLAALMPTALAALGRWLVVAEPLGEARAIAVLAGDLPFRAMEGAVLHRQGWAPEVWLTRVEPKPGEQALARLGIHHVPLHEYDREVLARSGVPVSAIRVLEEGVVNTADEVRVIAGELQRVGGRRVIIVTSKPHTRRVRAIWSALVGDRWEAVVRPTTEDVYDPARWWRTTGDAKAVVREVFGLLNVWAGFPIQPRR
jgi:uncharacterized SAM-binding protein YcdF (DUF218 family)